MHYMKNNVYVNGDFGRNTAVAIVKENLPFYLDKEWGTVQILEDIISKIGKGSFNDILFRQDLTQLDNCKGGFTEEEKEHIKTIVINEVRAFLQNCKGDVNRLEGLVKDWS
ncbi:hypothetical protein [Clostridium cylindrosporum]|uniref:Uncharacterized protein n=1 Tax=Clostridium cylindrosporum DSM 605 TaxID=1121307 RepID=A0A0J8G0E3_CLOCY|nr:hypothetical protein [Clostridium cylindrosporum]KMT21256.1 hypothetical protein CLCY_2c00160 [Clostridium cylindrosporum DSM 605]